MVYLQISRASAALASPSVSPQHLLTKSSVRLRVEP